MNKLKKIPKFKSEKEEREFWQKADSTLYVDYKKIKNKQFPNLKLTSKPVTVRLPINMVNKLKVRAHKMDVPYQSLIKKYIFDGLIKSS